MRMAWMAGLVWLAACGAEDGGDTDTDEVVDSGSFCMAGALDCPCRPGFGDAPGTCDDPDVQCLDGLCVAQ